MERPEPRPFHERTLYSAEEERALLLDGVAHLPDQFGYLWLKTRSHQAIRLRTELVELPQGEEFRHAVAELRDEPLLGERISRADYEREIVERDRKWVGAEEESEPGKDRWEKTYRQQESLWRA
jgi:hypothetical protein